MGARARGEPGRAPKRLTTTCGVYFIFSDALANIFGLAGAIIEQDYDAEKIDADLTTVKMDTPDGQHVETAFDLAKLR